ncbi:MAG TPA: pilin [Xanthomonadaceae bacterium]|nr:pilin [Xanthomonadaceae bacterium]
MKKMQGFTLIELMIVIAILGILIAIALPAYQDYTVRAKVSECVEGAAGIKTSVSEFRSSNAHFPSGLASVGTTGAGGSGDTKYCDTLSVASTGVITINVDEAAVGVTSGTISMQLSPTLNTAGDIDWRCKNNNTTKVAYLPASCRN